MERNDINGGMEMIGQRGHEAEHVKVRVAEEARTRPPGAQPARWIPLELDPAQVRARIERVMKVNP